MGGPPVGGLSYTFVISCGRQMARILMALLIASAADAFRLPAVSSADAFRLPAVSSVAQARTSSAQVMRMPWDPEPEPDEDSDKKKVEKKIDMSGLFQVMSMGAGAPMLGDLKKTNFEKPESEGGAALQFELEANK